MQDFGKRVQRCFGCFIAYHLKDMYLGEDVTLLLRKLQRRTMFHFNDFSKLLESRNSAKLRKMNITLIFNEKSNS